jgi:hypothetical protein
VTAGGEHLEALWGAAAVRPVVAMFRTAALDVSTPQGPLLAAVDKDSRRHLLVPLAAKHTLRHDVDGRAVVLRRRTLEDEDSYRSYASLELVDPNFEDLFTALCAEVVERVAATPDRAVAAMRKVLEDWRALLAGTREILTPSALAGLFGELDILRRMIVRDPGALTFWTGPSGSTQDFHRGVHGLEVKTTTAVEGRKVQIHGIDQLDVAPAGSLMLHWSRLRTDRGVSVPDLVDEILGRTDDSSAFRRLLREVGYHEADREIYTRRRFEVVENRSYTIDSGFPRIVRSGLTGDAVLAGIGPVDYTVDLDSPAAEALRIHVDPIDEFMGGR